jgi:hypothetical protein
MEDCPGEFMPLFTAIQLSERSLAFRFMIYIGQSMNSLIDSAQFSDPREFGGVDPRFAAFVSPTLLARRRVSESRRCCGGGR